jgi:predicted O-methyltransferase YrrM
MVALAIGFDAYQVTQQLRFIEPLMTAEIRINDLKSPEPYFTRVSDIYAHLPTLYYLTVDKAFRDVLELGTRTGESTIVLLAAVRETSGHVTSIDMQTCPETRRRVQEEDLANYWTFIQSDDLSLDWKAPIDHLFIDTSHEYLHTKQELEKFEPLVRSGGAITLHDTTSHLEVWRAISEYFEGRKDVRIRRFLHNNGLAVIEKLP